MPVVKPYLRDSNPVSFEEIPEAAAYEAGFLVTKNAGWRNFRPVVNEEKCVGCLQCYLYCPDGVIFKKDKKAVLKKLYDMGLIDYSVVITLDKRSKALYDELVADGEIK